MIYLLVLILTGLYTPSAEDFGEIWRVAADVFGYAAWLYGDTGIGQKTEDLVPISKCALSDAVPLVLLCWNPLLSTCR